MYSLHSKRDEQFISQDDTNHYRKCNGSSFDTLDDPHQCHTKNLSGGKQVNFNQLDVA